MMEKYNTAIYTLDAIIAVGYRINSKKLVLEYRLLKYYIEIVK